MANIYEKRFFTKMSSDIKEMFAKLQDTLKSRETQLLRQIEVLSQHCQLTESYDKYSKEISLVFDHSNDLFQSISSLGKINFSGLHCTSEVFQIEDYQKQEIDHDSFNKYLDKSETNNCKKESNLFSIVTTSTENKHKQCTKEKCETETTKSNSLLECIGKDDPKLCQHNTNMNTNKINHEHRIHCDSEYQCNCFIINNQRKYVCNCSSNKVECIRCSSNCSCSCRCNDLIDDKVRKISLQQPVPIQHWMNDIILETELEPTSNNIMEHSQIEEK